MALHITPCPDAVPKKQKVARTSNLNHTAHKYNNKVWSVFIEGVQVYKLFKVRKNVGLYVPYIQLVKVTKVSIYVK